jgi:hypothetical protein
VPLDRGTTKQNEEEKMKMPWTTTSEWVTGPLEYHAGEYLICGPMLRYAAKYRFEQYYDIYHGGERIGDAPTLKEAKAMATQCAASRDKNRSAA